MPPSFTLGQTTLPAPAGSLTPVAQQQWISGISQAEGFGIPGATPTIAHNPGDLKLGDIGYGTTNGITNFPSDEAGTAALANQINHFYDPPSGSPYSPDETISQLAQTYTGGDNSAGWADTVSQHLGTTPFATPNQAALGQVPSQSAVGIAQSTPATNPQVQQGNPMPDPIEASPLPTQNVTDEQLRDISPPLVDPTGLDTQPWYQDTNIITGNPRLHKMGFPQGFPVVFEVYMDQNDVNSLLTSDGTPSGIPIVIPLNCSLERFNVASRHIVNKEPTRTGFHITIWGMAADVITGSGSTGVFMNQFGLTDFLSLAETNSDAVQAVLAAYTNTNRGVDLEQVYLATGNPSQPATPLTQQAANLNAQQIADGGNSQMQNYAEPFRIAAEDAFVEFLSLFKMNGTTWLHPSGYSFDSDNNNAPNVQNNANQTSALAVYSTGVGATDFEIKARNNDVYKRGYVVMKFRNSQYLGFFKSLSWAMDAEKPYQWKFNFVFQVERTLSLVYYPSPQAAPTLADSSIASSGVLNA